MAELLTCPGPTKSFPGFCPQGIALLRTLKRKKRSDWLASDQELYDFKITNPLLDLVCSVSREFARFAPDYATLPAKAVFRLFGESASARTRIPTRPPTAIWVHKDAEGGMRGACFYFHFTEKEAVLLGGIYSPDASELLACRRLLSNHYAEFEKILSDRKLSSLMGKLKGAKLSRIPNGFSARHPAAEFLRRREWYLVTMLDMPLLSTDRLLSTLVSHFEAMTPFVEFLNRPFVRRPKLKRASFAVTGKN